MRSDKEYSSRLPEPLHIVNLAGSSDVLSQAMSALLDKRGLGAEGQQQIPRVRGSGAAGASRKAAANGQQFPIQKRRKEYRCNPL
jgi:hypothetical protein